jgi:hypothetical protein
LAARSVNPARRLGLTHLGGSERTRGYTYAQAYRVQRCIQFLAAAADCRDHVVQRAGVCKMGMICAAAYGAGCIRRQHAAQMRSLWRDGFVGQVSERCYFRAGRSIAELFGFSANDLAAGRAYLLRRSGELRLPARQIRRCAYMPITSCNPLTQSLKDALENCFAFQERWLINRSKVASTFADIASEAVFSIAIRPELL